jgi:hypothetical protein
MSLHHTFQSKRESAGGTQDAADLAQRRRRLEPVERVGDEDGVDGRIGKWNRLRGAGVADGAGGARLEHRAHLVIRLDGHDLGEPVHKPARQLPRSGTKIDDARIAAQAERVLGPPQRLRRVPGSCRVVVDRYVAEAAGQLRA